MTCDDDPAIERLYYSVIGAFYAVYNTLGYGFLEHIYMAALERELLARGHRVAREVVVTVHYKGDELGTQRLDMLVDERLIVEGKAGEGIPRSASRQVHSYICATPLRHGLLLHFGPEAHFYRLGRPRGARGV